KADARSGTAGLARSPSPPSALAASRRDLALGSRNAARNWLTSWAGSPREPHPHSAPTRPTITNPFRLIVALPVPDESPVGGHAIGIPNRQVIPLGPESRHRPVPRTARPGSGVKAGFVSVALRCRGWVRGLCHVM